MVETEAEALAAFDEIGAPVVLKPLDGNQGKGVTVCVRTKDEASAAFAVAQERSRRVVVEQMLEGNDYRVIVIGGRVVAASRRDPPMVTGDGTRTIGELVAVANQDPRRGEGHEKPLTAIRLDDTAIAHLAHAGSRPGFRGREGPDRVAARKREPLDRRHGAGRDRRVHPEVRRLCERAARVIGLDICGVDLMSPDIAQPSDRTSGIVELNAGPGIRMHHYPSAGMPRDVGGAIVEMLVPGRARTAAFRSSRSPARTARRRSPGWSRTRSAVARRRVGMTTTDGVWIGGEQVAHGDMTGPRSAQVVLGGAAVEVAVLETARGGIVAIRPRLRLVGRRRHHQHPARSHRPGRDRDARGPRAHQVARRSSACKAAARSCSTPTTLT